jgi:hypothetical protein
VQAWVPVELIRADLGDARRDERYRMVVDRLSENPQGGINGACLTAAERKGAYRLLGNKDVQAEQMLEPHLESTWRRAQRESVVLIAQDTTELDYSRHPYAQQLGPLHPGGRGWGYLLHTGLVLTTEGVPLGVGHQQQWVRDPEETGKRATRRERAWEEKESYKWQRTVEAGAKHRQPGQTKIYVGDAEADIFALLASPREEGEALLVRAAQDRRVKGEPGRLQSLVRAEPVAGCLRVSVSRGGAQEPREAWCHLRFREVILRPPKHPAPGTPQEPVRVWAVLVEEPTPPEGHKAACWLLLATWPITDLAGAVQCARYYGLRWRVERYHYTLKSGCRVEQAQLRTWEGLERLQAVCAVVAWRLLWMTYLARATPEISCEQAFTRLEWRVALGQAQGQLPAEGEAAPSLGRMVALVAKLGGWWGRKGDRAPGVKVLWRGLTKLEAMVEGFQLATSPSKPRCG